MKKILFAAYVFTAAFSLHASSDGYFMLSVFSPGQLPSSAYSIRGGRLSLVWGDCHEFYGVDTGVAGTTQESAYGLQANAVWTDVDADMFGAQIGGLINTVKGTAFGFQSAACNWSGELAGCQLGLLNVADGSYGCQLGGMNVADDFYGCQLGVANVADDLYGCQIGVVNVADKLYGCQLGAFNVVTTRDCPVWIILNVGW